MPKPDAPRPPGARCHHSLDGLDITLPMPAPRQKNTQEVFGLVVFIPMGLWLVSLWYLRQHDLFAAYDYRLQVAMPLLALLSGLMVTTLLTGLFVYLLNRKTNKRDWTHITLRTHSLSITHGKDARTIPLNTIESLTDDGTLILHSKEQISLSPEDDETTRRWLTEQLRLATHTQTTTRDAIPAELLSMLERQIKHQ